jgi:hypothetical protein
MHTRSSLKELAFHEYKVTRQTSTGNGELYAGHVTLKGEPRVPAGFVRGELGYDGPVGIRLQVWVDDEDIKERHKLRMRAEAAGIDAPACVTPKRKTGKRETKWSRLARAQNSDALKLVEVIRVAA